MLQLAYHAPPQIAKQAVKLLKAIRSPVIIPELKAIFLDEEYDVHLRREIYEVICATQGNYDFSEFEPLIGTVIRVGDLPGLFRLLKNHPINEVWILHYLEVKKPYSLLFMYSRLLEYLPEFATEQILKILSENEHPIWIKLGFQLHKFGGDIFKYWLDKNWNRIILSWLTDEVEFPTEYENRLRAFTKQREMLDNWPELRDSISNISPEWLLSQISSQNLTDQRLIYFRLLPYAPKTASDLLMQLIEQNHIIPDLETAGMFHQYGDESVQSWLREKWDELIYLCLIDGVGIQNQLEKMRIVHVLEKWPELKEAVFHNCPAMIEEYEEIKATDTPIPSQQVSDSDIQATPIWQSLKQSRDEWVEQTEIGLKPYLFSHHLGWQSLRSEIDIPVVAAENYFLGTILPYDYHSFGNSLRTLLRRSLDQWRRVIKMEDDPEAIFVYSPVRFEAAYAIRNFIEPRNWECMVEAVLMCKNELAETPVSLEDNLFRWISRMTDMLSGVEPELPDEEIPLNARPWFCALVNQNPSEVVTQSEV